MRRRRIARRKAGCAPPNIGSSVSNHVREYNNSYNFFAGMSDEAVAKYQKDDLTGHRPTWKMGSLGGKRSARRGRGKFRDAEFEADDPFSLFGETGASRPGHARPAGEDRKIFNAQRRALDALGLETDAKRADIKSRFKDAGKTASSRRQWRRPRLGRAVAGDHSSL